jgi:hypothetical protein
MTSPLMDDAEDQEDVHESAQVEQELSQVK